MGLFIFCRVRRNRVQLLNGSQVGNEEEEIPLTSNIGAQGDEDEDIFRKRKGKERAMDGGEASEEAIFDVGDSDDEDGYKSADDRRR